MVMVYFPPLVLSLVYTNEFRKWLHSFIYCTMFLLELKEKGVANDCNIDGLIRKVYLGLADR